MADSGYLVLVAGYQDPVLAREQFDDPLEQVQGKQARAEGASSWPRTPAVG